MTIDEPRRNPPRDWAAPPPWLASAEAASRGAGEPNRRTSSAAGRRARSAAWPAAPPTGWPAALRHPAGDRRTTTTPGRARPLCGADQRVRRSDGRTRSTSDGADDLLDDRGRAAPAGPPAARLRPAPRRTVDGPDWERPRRYEAYPTIKTRIGMPAIAAARRAWPAVLALAALALFFLPGILGHRRAGDTGPDVTVALARPRPRRSRRREPPRHRRRSSTRSRRATRSRRSRRPTGSRSRSCSRRTRRSRTRTGSRRARRS